MTLIFSRNGFHILPSRHCYASSLEVSLTVFALFVLDMKGTAMCPPGWKKNLANDVLEKGFKKDKE